MQIVSPSNRDFLVVEILYDNAIIAEINQDGGALEIEIYPSTTDKILNLPLEAFQTMLEKAKLHLLDKNRSQTAQQAIR